MFKFETFARVLVAVLIFSFGMISSATEKTPSEIKDIMEDLRREKCIKADGSYKDTEVCKDLRDRLKSGGGAAAKCEEEAKEFNESANKLVAACTGVGFGSTRPSDGKAGVIGCSHEIMMCKCATESPDSPEGRKLGCPAFNSEYKGRKSINYNVEKLDKLANLCPPLAGSDMKDLREEAKEAREKIRELEKSMDEANEAATQAQTDAQKELGEIADQGKDAANTAMQEQKEIRNSVRDSKAQLQEKITQLNAQRQEIDGRIAQFIMEGQKADLSYQQSVTQLKTSCHARAIAEISEKRKVDLLLAAQQPKGGQAALLKKIGTSIERDYQRQAKRRYEQCMADLSIKESKNDLVKARNMAIDNMNAQARAEEEKRKEVANQINTMQAPCGVATGTVSGTSELCQITTDARQDMMDVGLKLQQERAAINRKMQTASSAAAAKAAAQNAKAERARAEIMEEQARLRELEAVIAIKNNASVDESSRQSFIEARTEFMNLSAKASNLFSQCCEKDPNGSGCSKADAFLWSIMSPGHPRIKDGKLYLPDELPKTGDAKR